MQNTETKSNASFNTGKKKFFLSIYICLKRQTGWDEN